MPPAPQEVVKAGNQRSLRRAAGADGRPLAIKRFERRGLGLRARRRARRELAVLEHVAARGGPVPAPLGLQRRAGAFEVCMRWIDGARPVDALLEEGRPTCPPEGLGAVIAALHAAGVDHPDLHAGNVLVDSERTVWAIDFHAARLRRRLGGDALCRDLVTMWASLRELAPREFLVRMLRGWLRELPAELAARVQPADTLELRVRTRARDRRREIVRKRRLRWLRESSACRAASAGDRTGPGARPGAVRGWLRRDVEDGELEAILAARPDGSVARIGRRDLAVFAGDADLLCRSWLAAARLVEHHIPAARPLALFLGDAPRLALELPRAAHTSESPGSPVSPPGSPASSERARAWTASESRPADAAALGGLAGRLFDRGLVLDGAADLLSTPQGVPLLGRVADLAAAETFPHASEPHPPGLGEAQRRLRAVMSGTHAENALQDLPDAAACADRFLAAFDAEQDAGRFGPPTAFLPEARA